MTQDLSKPINLPNFSNLDMDFDIIDSHHHLFDLNNIYYPWLTDRPEEDFLLGDYEALKKNYPASAYLADTGALRVIKTVHVEAEADHNNPVSETQWLVETIKNTGLPSAIVAHAWLHLPETEKILETQSSFEAVKGIRSKPITSTSPRSRHSIQGKPGSMQDPVWRQGLGLLRKFDLSWDLRVPFWHLTEAAEVCALYPDIRIIVEHTGLAWDRSEDGLAEWRKGMKALAECENVFLKISELGLAYKPWDYNENRCIVREAIALFGFKRCMFASNFPVSGLRIGYVDQAKAVAHMIKDCSETERRSLFHDSANSFYRLED